MKAVKVKNQKGQELDDLKSQLVRALADYDNLRKRVEKEREDFRRNLSVSIILRLIPVMDNLEEAQKHLKDSGIAITIKGFEDVLREEGIQRINISVGDSFDEKLHEVTEVVDSDKKDGIIANEVVSGWKFEDGAVIRHAKVKVYKKILSDK